MKKLGLDYPSVKQINSRIVYGTITGYGNEGPWADKPGQDLLAQRTYGSESSGPIRHTFQRSPR